MTVIDEYLQPLPADKRAALERLRTFAHELIPDAEETISYMLPCFRWRGKVVFGFAALKEGIGLYPFSGSVVPVLTEELTDYKTTPGAIRIPLDKPIARSTVEKIVKLRQAAILEKEK